jgi:hypothetical protein
VIVDAGNLPVSGVRQNSGGGNFVTAYWLPEEQQLIDIMKNNWSG